MRCLTLAEYLRKEGAEVIFICRDHPGAQHDVIMDKGFELIILEYTERGAVNVDHEDQYKRWLAYPLETDRDQTLAAIAQLEQAVDLLIVDHYGIDAAWQGQLRRAVEKIMVIDDLANREYDCDILLDQNCHIDYKTRYDKLVPESCRKLLGLEYAMIREEFAEAREELKERSGEINNIVIFYGGIDQTGETLKALKAIETLARDNLTVTVIAGRGNPHFEQVAEYCRGRENVEHLEKTGSMAKILAGADLALGAGGSTTWERCTVGLPSLITAVADNQEAVSKLAETYGFGIYLGRPEETTQDNIANRINMLMENPAVMKDISKRAGELVDGNGTRRVAETIFELCGKPEHDTLQVSDK